MPYNTSPDGDVHPSQYLFIPTAYAMHQPYLPDILFIYQIPIMKIIALVLTYLYMLYLGMKLFREKNMDLTLTNLLSTIVSSCLVPYSLFQEMKSLTHSNL